MEVYAAARSSDWHFRTGCKEEIGRRLLELAMAASIWQRKSITLTLGFFSIFYRLSQKRGILNDDCVNCDLISKYLKT